MTGIVLVRVFELASLVLVIACAAYIWRRLDGNRHYYANLIACGGAFLWEWYMDIGPLQLGYDPGFINLWVINGVSLPVMIPFAYAWYFFLPNLILLPRREWIDRHWGNAQYLYIFLLTGLYNIAVEWPATTLGGLWHYYWKAWTIGGVPATNMPMAGFTSLLIYLFSSRIAMKQDERQPFGMLCLHHLAWVGLGFYLSWVVGTYALGMTMHIWHE